MLFDEVLAGFGSILRAHDAVPGGFGSMLNCFDVIAGGCRQIVRWWGGCGHELARVIGVVARWNRLIAVRLAAVLAQRNDALSRIGMPALVSAGESFFGFGQPVLSGDQHCKCERAVGVPGVVRLPIRRLGSSDIASMLEQHAKVVSGVGMAALAGSPKRRFSFGQPIRPGKHHAELERAIGIAALVGAKIRRRRESDVSAFFEQHAEVVGGGGVAALISPREPCLGFREAVLSSQNRGVIEGALRTAALADTMVRHDVISQLSSPSLGRGGLDSFDGMGRSV